MGKQTIITCDKCGKNLAGGSYVVIAVSAVKNGAITKQPSVWLCGTCWLKTGLIGNCEEEK